MTPSKASTVFRELLQTSDAELAMFARRAGLAAVPGSEDLVKARELLEAVGGALESGAGRDWEKVRAAWAGLRTKQELFSPAVAGPSGMAEPPKPPMAQRFVVPKPALGDLAPGAAGAADQAKAKFVPVAKPRYVPPSGGASATPPSMPAASPGAIPAAPAAPLVEAATVASAYAAASPQSPQTMAAPYGGAVASGDWSPPLPAPPPMLAPLGPTPEQQGVSSPFTRAQAAAPPALYAAPGGPFGYGPSAPAPYASASAPPTPAPAPAPEPAPAFGPSAAPPPPPKRRVAATGADAGSASAAAAGVALDESAGSVAHSVAQYAAFCAACAEFPARLAQTMAGYGVANEGARTQLDQLWQERFDDDPDRLAKWEELFQTFRASLRAQG